MDNAHLIRHYLSVIDVDELSLSEFICLIDQLRKMLGIRDKEFTSTVLSYCDIMTLTFDIEDIVDLYARKVLHE